MLHCLSVCLSVCYSGWLWLPTDCVERVIRSKRRNHLPEWRHHSLSHLSDVTFTCLPGHFFHRNVFHKTVTCQADGSWSPTYVKPCVRTSYILYLVVYLLTSICLAFSLLFRQVLISMYSGKIKINLTCARFTIHKYTISISVSENNSLLSSVERLYTKFVKEVIEFFVHTGKLAWGLCVSDSFRDTWRIQMRFHWLIANARYPLHTFPHSFPVDGWLPSCC